MVRCRSSRLANLLHYRASCGRVNHYRRHCTSKTGCGRVSQSPGEVSLQTLGCSHQLVAQVASPPVLSDGSSTRTILLCVCCGRGNRTTRNGSSWYLVYTREPKQLSHLIVVVDSSIMRGSVPPGTGRYKQYTCVWMSEGSEELSFLVLVADVGERVWAGWVWLSPGKGLVMLGREEERRREETALRRTVHLAGGASALHTHV